MIDGETSPSTTTEAAARRIRQDVLTGTLAPGARLRLRSLADRYAMGTTPLREALSRLAAEGFVHLEGQKGYSVPPLTRSHLLDITRTRQILEPEALRLSVQHGDAAWEDGIVASLSLLQHQAAQQGQAGSEWSDDFETKHRRFHTALIAACPLPQLLRFCGELYVQSTRYRRVMRTSIAPATHADLTHEAIAGLALKRDAMAAADSLRRHVGVAADGVLHLFASP